MTGYSSKEEINDSILAMFKEALYEYDKTGKVSIADKFCKAVRLSVVSGDDEIILFKQKE